MIGWILLGVIGGIVVLFFVVYFILAKENLWFTFVEEGTVKAVMTGGEFRKFLIAWKGHTFKITKEGKQKEAKDNWEVVEGKEPSHPLGGLRFFGLWPIDRILEYKFRWTHLHEDGKAVTHGEWLDFVLLKTDLYVIEYPLTEKEAAEDIDGVPLGINLVMPIRILNPYIALFMIRRWLPLITGVTKATLRAFVAKYRFKEDLIDMVAGKGIEDRQREKGIKEADLAHPGDNLREKLREALKKALMEKGKEEKTEIEERGEDIYMYGALIRWRGTDIISIDPHPMYREATTLKYRAERDREKTIIDADAKAKAAASIALQKALEAGKMHSEIKKILMEESNLKPDEAEKQASEYVEYWKGSEEKVIEDWRFRGTEGGGLYAEAAKFMAVAETAKKIVNQKGD